VIAVDGRDAKLIYKFWSKYCEEEILEDRWTNGRITPKPVLENSGRPDRNWVRSAQHSCRWKAGEQTNDSS
jgi:hypothetical protein